MTVTTHAGKGSPLAYDELDANFTGLDGGVTSASQGVTAMQSSLSTTSISDRNRVNHTGFDPASNVKFSDQQTLEQWRSGVDAILAGISSSAPVNTVAPTAPSGSVTVASTLTANQGTWTGSGLTYVYQWRSAGVAIVGATSTTYVLRISDTGFYITCTVTATSSNGLSNSATSPAVGPVTATLPTISVAPAVTPSGTQSVGTLLTTTNGTWTNGGGATYTYQWYFNANPIVGATAITYTPVIGQEGGSIYVKVWATTGQGTSAAGAQSNTITTSAAAAITNSTPPAWNGTLYMGVANVFTVGTWTGSINPALTNWEMFRNSETTPFIGPARQVNSYTPAAPAVVGDTIYIQENVFSSSTGARYSVMSGGAVLQAAPAAFAAVQAATGLNWTVGQAINSIAPVTASGGTTPYTFAIKSGTTALPSGVTINSATGVLSGTPTVSSTLTTYTIHVNDAAAASADVQFTATVATAALTEFAVSLPTALGGLYANDAWTGDRGQGWGGHQVRIVEKNNGDIYMAYVYGASSGASRNYRILKRIEATGVWSSVTTGQTWYDVFMFREPITDSVHVIAYPNLVWTIYSEGSSFNTGSVIRSGEWHGNNGMVYASVGVGANGTVVLQQGYDAAGDTASVVENWTAGTWNGTAWTFGAISVGSAGDRYSYEYLFPGGNGTPGTLVGAQMRDVTKQAAGIPNATGTYVWEGFRMFQTSVSSASPYTITTIDPKRSNPDNAFTGTACFMFEADAYCDSQGRLFTVHSTTSGPTPPGSSAAGIWLSVVNAAGTKIYGPTIMTGATGYTRLVEDNQNRIWALTFQGNQANPTVELRRVNADFSIGSVISYSSAFAQSGAVSQDGWDVFVASVRGGNARKAYVTGTYEDGANLRAYRIKLPA